MVGPIKRFVTLAKLANNEIKTTHCLLHLKALVAKTLGFQLKATLDVAVKMVNFIKSKPLKFHLFTMLCEEMGSQNVSLILHTEVRWLLRGKVVSRVFDLKEEMLRLFTVEDKKDFCKLLTSTTWCPMLAHIEDIFEKLNKIISSLQGRNNNILTSTDKIQSLNNKIIIWKVRVAKGNVDMFLNAAVTNYKDYSAY